MSRARKMSRRISTQPALLKSRATAQAACALKGCPTTPAESPTAGIPHKTEASPGEGSGLACLSRLSVVRRTHLQPGQNHGRLPLVLPVHLAMERHHVPLFKRNPDEDVRPSI